MASESGIGTVPARGASANFRNGQAAQATGYFTFSITCTRKNGSSYAIVILEDERPRASGSILRDAPARYQLYARDWAVEWSPAEAIWVANAGRARVVAASIHCLLTATACSLRTGPRHRKLCLPSIAILQLRTSLGRDGAEVGPDISVRRAEVGAPKLVLLIESARWVRGNCVISIFGVDFRPP